MRDARNFKYDPLVGVAQAPISTLLKNVVPSPRVGDRGTSRIACLRPGQASTPRSQRIRNQFPY